MNRAVALVVIPAVVPAPVVNRKAVKAVPALVRGLVLVQLVLLPAVRNRLVLVALQHLVVNPAVVLNRVVPAVRVVRAPVLARLVPAVRQAQVVLAQFLQARNPVNPAARPVQIPVVLVLNLPVVVVPHLVKARLLALNPVVRLVHLVNPRPVPAAKVLSLPVAIPALAVIPVHLNLLQAA